MKIAFVTTYDARDIRNWSGTPYFMSKAFIDAGAEVEFIGDLKTLRTPSLWIRANEFLFNKLLRKKLGHFISDYEPHQLKYFSNQVQKRLINSDADVVFSPGAIPIAYLDTDKPVAMWSDATFAIMYKYYDGFSNYSFNTIRSCHSYERNLMKRLSLAVFSSDWAAQSAIKDYGASESIVKVIPYGANIQMNRTVTDIIEYNRKKSRTVCKLLFIGREWERKGGATAVSIAKEMNRLNVRTELAIVGCNPVESSSFPEYIKVHGFVDKSRKEGDELIGNLYRESHFFVLPTVADCTPIVFSEANSCGLPVITINTGGIPSVITNDVNGKMFEIDFDVKSCSAYICTVFNDYERYEEFSVRSFSEYSRKLNWKVSIAKTLGYLEEVLEKKHSGQKLIQS